MPSSTPAHRSRHPVPRSGPAPPQGPPPCLPAGCAALPPAPCGSCPLQSCPAMLSSRSRPAAPSTSPAEGGTHAATPSSRCAQWPAAAGSTLAANMMPAAIPLSTRWVRGAARPTQQEHPGRPSVVHTAGNSSTRPQNDLVQNAFPFAHFMFRQRKGERAAEKPAGFPAGSSSCNNYKEVCECQNEMSSSPSSAGSAPSGTFTFSGKQHDKSSQNCHLH